MIRFTAVIDVITKQVMTNNVVPYIATNMAKRNYPNAGMGLVL